VTEIYAKEGHMKKSKRKDKTTAPFQIENVEQVCDAFDIYYFLGEERSLAEVSKRMELPEATLVSWHKVFGWEERVALWDTVLTDRIEAEAVRQKREASALLKEGLGGMIVDFFQGNAQAKKDHRPLPHFIRNVKELERVVELFLRVPGPPRQTMVLDDHESMERFNELLEADECARDILYGLWRKAAGNDTEK
jgi:hypothetical protein